jgi:SAM-dependent methyltransferase
MPSPISPLKPDQLLRDYWVLLKNEQHRGSVLDLACGDGHNGIFLAGKGFSVSCWDVSSNALSRAKRSAADHGVEITFQQVDLEREGDNPLPKDAFEGIVVFRYLHRPLIDGIKKSLKNGGILIYETFTVNQVKFGKPHNPDFLLKQGEMSRLFADWNILHHFEGIKSAPERAIAQIVCRKPTSQEPDTLIS